MPHVAGVRTSNGDELRSDLVVDATGRQSRSPRGSRRSARVRPYEEQEDCGFTYYTRYFRGRPASSGWGPCSRRSVRYRC